MLKFIGRLFSKLDIELEQMYILHKDSLDKLVPICISNESLIKFSCAYIETLHILHNHLQKSYFGFPDSYSYVEENKPIEWDKYCGDNQISDLE
ncbi:MAG: hypothetical protein QG670_1912 [Thermoproteota archaeon]|nr:hypothetical protein [Thermoproteota archaeon]